MKKVGIVMGSDSDLPILQKTMDTLTELGIPYECHIYSAHRTPEEAGAFARNARENGIGVIIAAAGMAAHLAGTMAANTVLPVIGIPCKSTYLDGIDALLLPSLAKHLMLFRYLGFKLPKYMHIAQIMRLDENGNKKKLSKRDMGANMDDYSRMGYAPAAVCEYVMTLLNSNYEEWHMQNPDKPYTEFPFNIKKMSNSGCLFDFNKLNDVSKNVLCRMTAEEVYEQVAEWAKENDPELATPFTANSDYTKAILAIGRGGKKPRKDFATWTDVKPYLAFFYDELFQIVDSYEDKFDKADIKQALQSFLAVFDPADDMNTWFEKIKTIAEDMGYASDMKAYKADPDAFRGNVADVSMFLRVAVTGKLNAPDLYTVMHSD